MKRAHISRRRFALMAGTAGVVAPGLMGAEPLTAEVVVRRIQTELGGDWPSTGPDPTFYSHTDGRAMAESTPGRGRSGFDPVVKEKREFIEKNGLVVFRLRDHWQARKENDMVTGLASALGWSARRVKNDDALYDIPPATTEATVALIRSKLNLRAGLRVVGDRDATIRRVLLFPGSMTPATMWQRYSEVDLIVAGEVREWENTHYAADMFTAGEKRALVTTGRVVSEEPGMRVCAEWLMTVVKEVPAKWIGVGDPYWRPAA
jgi:hypothetical protein